MGRRFITGASESEKAPAKLETTQQKQIDKKRSKRKKKRGRNKENKKAKELFPRQKDGFTSLSILPPTGEGIVPGTDKDRPISLGHLIGRVKVGTSYLYGFREDKRNIVKAMYPISYNFYSSYGPTYDSTFSSLTLEETQLIQTGDKFSSSHSKQFADLIKNCCREDYTHTFVDRLLDILEGRDSNHTSDVEQHQETDQDDGDGLVDFDSLKTLNEEGIDMSFVDNLKEKFEAVEAEKDAKRNLEERLDRTAVLINNLKSSQTNRLNVCPNFNLNQVEQPSEFEMKLATKVLDNLNTILQSTKPGEVVDVTSVRRSMGVNIPGPTPAEQPSTDDPVQSIHEAASSSDSTPNPDTTAASTPNTEDTAVSNAVQNVPESINSKSSATTAAAGEEDDTSMEVCHESKAAAEVPSCQELAADNCIVGPAGDSASVGGDDDKLVAAESSDVEAKVASEEPVLKAGGDQTATPIADDIKNDEESKAESKPLQMDGCVGGGEVIRMETDTDPAGPMDQNGSSVCSSLSENEITVQN